jgi:hypothetical protein
MMRAPPVEQFSVLRTMGASVRRKSVLAPARKIIQSPYFAAHFVPATWSAIALAAESFCTDDIGFVQSPSVLGRLFVAKKITARQNLASRRF